MKKITFKEYFATLFGGIWQAILWVVGLFGFNDEAKFWKAVKRIFASCATILLVMFTCCMVYAFAVELVYEEFIKPYTSNRVWDETHLSNDIVLQQMYYSSENRVYDKSAGKVLLKDVDWVVTSGNGDSLAVFARDGKRGYLNRFTGKVEIPELYTRAWVFSDGLAAVEKDNELLFIDRSGNVVIDKDFQVRYDDPKYAFKSGYCAVENPSTGKVGLIDKSGNWALDAEYDELSNSYGFWRAEKDGYEGLYTAELDVLFPVENTGIFIYDSVIEVRHKDHTAKRYDYNGNVVVDFVIDDVSNMQYEMAEFRNDLVYTDDEAVDRSVYGIADCQRYTVKSGNWCTDYYGLLNRDGKVVTQPLYTSIEAIGKDLYLCQPHGVILNGRGEVVQ